MAQKGVSGKEIEICLKYGHAVEFHDEANELRAVIRHAFGKPKVAVCVVIGLGTGTIATCWKNEDFVGGDAENHGGYDHLYKDPYGYGIEEEADEEEYDDGFAETTDEEDQD